MNCKARREAAGEGPGRHPIPEKYECNAKKRDLGEHVGGSERTEAQVATQSRVGGDGRALEQKRNA